jgi:hypothetical protein
MILIEVLKKLKTQSYFEFWGKNLLGYNLPINSLDEA